MCEKICFFCVSHRCKKNFKMNVNAQDDDVIIESSRSGSATPMGPSNPETPRSLLECEARNTPPPSASGPSSASRQSQAVSGGSGQPPSFVSMHPQQQPSQSKYGQLLAVIEDMGKDIRPTYAGSKTSAERLKRGIMHARILVRECLMECDKAARN